MIGIVDYGAGNLRSVQASLGRLGAAWRPIGRPGDLHGDLDGVILPGVGQFGAAARSLAETGLAPALRDFARAGRPLLGICLGMQLLFEGSDEDRSAAGLGLLPGPVRRLEAARSPHIGWALVEPLAPPGGEASIFAGLPPEGFFAYFAHSYAAPPAVAEAAAVTSCPPRFASAVCRGRTWGVQFHPEKSGGDGQRIMLNFLLLARAAGER